MPRPTGTRGGSGGHSVGRSSSGHRIGGNASRSMGGFSGGRPGTSYRSYTPSNRNSGSGLGMGGLAGPIMYTLGHRNARRQMGGGMYSPYGQPYDGYGTPPYRPMDRYDNGYGGRGDSMPPAGQQRQASAGNTGTAGRRRGPGCFIVILLVFVVLIALGMMSGGSGGKSTIERHKLEGSPSFKTDCIADQIGWIGDKSVALDGLKAFYEETGVQPYVILKDYDPALTTDQQKKTWAEDFFDENINEEHAFLFVYFGEANVDYDVGYMCQVSGTKAKSIMDSEAVDIFWNNMDRYWTDGDLEMEEVISKVYSQTGSTIMQVSTTTNDVMKWLLIALVIIGAACGIFYIMRERNRRAKEKAEETERILKTPLKKFSDEESDELIDKYKDGDAADKAKAAKEAVETETAAEAETAGETAQQAADTAAETADAGYQKAPEIKLSDEDPLRTSTDDLIDKYKDPQ